MKYIKTFKIWEYIKAVGEVIKKEEHMYIVKNIITNDTKKLTTKQIAGLASKQTIEEFKLIRDTNKYNL